MANSKLTALTAYTNPDRVNDVVYIVDIANQAAKKITVNNLLGITGAPVGNSDTQSLTNKTLDNTNNISLKGSLFTLQDASDTTKTARFSLASITTSTLRTYTLPDVSDTIVTLTATQTLTNKTLTSPTINNATIANPTLTVDSISGYTVAGNGSVFGLSIASGVLQTANSVTNSNLSNTGTFGSAWSWTTYSPTWTNVTGGTFNYAVYSQIGKTVFVRFKYTLSGAGVSGAPIISLPVTATSNYNSTDNGETLSGTVGMIDAVTAYYVGFVMSNTTTTVRFRYSSATPNMVGVSSTLPFTWGNGDYIQASFMYEAA